MVRKVLGLMPDRYGYSHGSLRTAYRLRLNAPTAKADSSPTSTSSDHSDRVGTGVDGAGGGGAAAPPMNTPRENGRLPTIMGAPTSVLVAVSIAETVPLPAFATYTR